MTSPRSGSCDHDRALHDRAGAEDRHLRLVDDRGVEQRAPAAGVGQRERAAAQLVGRDLVGAGPLGQVGDLRAIPARLRSPASWMTGHEQAALGVHGDAEVLGVVVGDRAGLLVDGGVHRRVRLERLDRGLREERQERELHALAGLEVGLGLLPQAGDLVTSASTTVVSCALTCSDSTMRWAMTARSRDIFSVAPAHRGVGRRRGRRRPGAGAGGCRGWQRGPRPARRRPGRPACGCGRRPRCR